MKKIYVSLVAAVCGVMTLSSCAKEVINEEMMAEEGRLRVMTRADDDKMVKTPIQVYVMNEEGTCVATQTLAEESEQLSFDLEAGNYDIYAIGGAEEDRYVLPTMENATKNSALSLQSEKSYDDLMAGKSSIILTAGGENTVTLGLERKVMLIKSVVISNVPAEATAVSITISPLRKSLLLDGSYEGENGNCTVDLKLQDDDTTWKLESTSNYQLPSVGNPTITVNIDNKSYSYTCVEQLEENYKVNIKGEYVDNSGTPTVNLSGTITGASWEGEKDIHFKFDESGNSETVTEGDGDENDMTVPENMPKVGDVYKGCYVLAVNGNTIRILASEEKSGITDYNDSQTVSKGKIDGALAIWSVSGITADWELPDETDVQLIIDSYNGIRNSGVAAVGGSKTYLYDDNGIIKTYKVSQTESSTGMSYTAGSILRPVATVTIE